jgi:drug/metabolite transporter (DMT)-like permease
VDTEALFFIVLLGVLFGSTLVASRFSVGQFSALNYVGLRFLFVSLAYIGIYLFRIRGRMLPKDRRLWQHSIVLGIFGTAVPMSLIVSSLQYQSSGLTSILVTTGPAVTVVLAHFFLPDERLSRRKVSGVFLAFSGALLLAIRGESGLPDGSQASLWGYLMVILAMISGSLATVYARKYMQALDAFDVNGVRMFTGALLVLPLSLLLGGFDVSAVNRTGIFALLWAAIVGTFLGMMLSFYNIQRFGATAAAMTSYIVPVVASLGGVILLEEKITAGMTTGMALVIIGVSVINWRVIKKQVVHGY